ncbi:MAG: hypothetical protein KJ718_02170 [Nanoarchaeota archaeon]|nr:hypothetical protein [Nanoarchaeota archaeon]MBU1051340.1 hypothetical protein [Nanoarchaeota archaeon]MBU1988401.1 hypothetical protein [Nanoarchaeota archaeon]
MTVTLSNPNIWNPLSEARKSSELTGLIRGRFDEQINPENFKIREERGYIEVTAIDNTRGYCFAGRINERVSTIKSRIGLMKMNYKNQRLVITDEFISHDQRMAGFSWRSV